MCVFSQRNETNSYRPPPEPFPKVQDSPRIDSEAIVSAIEKIFLKSAQSIEKILEDSTARLENLEMLTKRLEGAVFGIHKNQSENHGQFDCRLRELENLVKEVHFPEA